MNEAKSILYDHFASLGGSLRASMSLGYRHLYGLSVPISCETALKYYSTVSSAVIDLAMQKQLQAVESISLLDENLRNNNPDEEQDIVQYYRDVADAGDPNAQLFLGHLNYFGTRGVQRNFDVARHYYNQAAQSGDVAALAQLGQMYLDGIGVPQNNETALKLLTKAVKEVSLVHMVAIFFS